MYLIIHETSIASLEKIVKADEIFKSSKVQALGLSLGQGAKGRRLASDPTVSITNPHFYNEYDEVDGVYFRLFPMDYKIKPKYNDCVMVFDKDVLNHYRFVINTEENFGFCIGPEGEEAEAQFSGEPGISILDLNNLPILNRYHFEPYSSEITIMDNVSLKYLRSIFVVQDKLDKEIMDLCHHKNIQLYAC